MARIAISLALLAILSLAGMFRVASEPGSVWTAIAVDRKGDGREAAGADAAQLAYQYDQAHDTLWFRLALFSQPPTDDFAIDVAIDSNAGASRKASWWGTNTNFAFDRLLHVQVSKAAGAYQASAEARDMAASESPAAKARVEAEVRVTEEAILIGFRRAMVLGASMKVNLIAAIGSKEGWNDDIPNVGSAAIDLTKPRPARGLREIDVSRNNLRFSPDQPILSEHASPQITESGHGPTTLILIPGVYSGANPFAGFMARHASAYTFHVITPPGLNGTAARALPTEKASVGEFHWTRRLAQDVRELIARRHLDKPIIIAHGFPGALAAEQLAATEPQLLGGVIEIAGMSPQKFPAPGDPRRQATPAERIAVVNESWVPLWFKYVTPETWESNNYPVEMFANDPPLAERVHQQVESVPLPVKIRYLVENMATDRRVHLEKLGVPMLALIPAFNETLLANPAFGWFKTSFQEGWEPLAGDARLELATIPAARALVLDDQPELADKAIASFVERIASPRMVDGAGRSAQPDVIDVLLHSWPTTLHEAVAFGVTTVIATAPKKHGTQQRQQDLRR